MLEPGLTFCDYRLVERIGRGGMGEVWLAIKRAPTGEDFKRVALKVLLPDLLEDDVFVRMFTAEARLAARLEHPNIVQVFDSGEHEDRLWFTQEYVDGSELRAVRRASPRGVPYPIALFVAGEILAALDYAHSLRGPDGTSLELVHRDVKPANVLVGKLGHVKVTDFGIAKAFGATTMDGLHTRTGHVRGTSGYLAPELVRGGRATPRSDLYALGIVLWELLTGRRLFSAEDQRRHAQGELPDPRIAEAHVSPDVEAFLSKLLAPNPERRFASAQLALATLRTVPGGRDASALEFRAYLAGLALSRIPLAAGRHDEDRAAVAVGSTSVGDMGVGSRFGAGPGAVVTSRSDAMTLIRPASASRAPARPSTNRRRVGLAIGTATAVGIAAAVITTIDLSADSNRRTATVPAARAMSLASVSDAGPGAAAAPLIMSKAEPDADVRTDAGFTTTRLQPQSRPANQAVGTLRVRVSPWARVYVDGGSVGVTPLNRKLAPGKHQVRLVNEELHKEEQMFVEVGSGAESVLERDW